MHSTLSTASTLLTADQEGKYGLSILLHIDTIERTPEHDAWGQIVHCSDRNEVYVKVTVFAGEKLAIIAYRVDSVSYSRCYCVFSVFQMSLIETAI